MKDIYESIKHFPKIGDMDLIIKIGQGNVTNLMKSEKAHPKDVPILKGDDIGRYKVRNIHYLPFSKVELEYLKPKLVFQEIVAHIQNPIPHIELMGVFDPNGVFTLHDTAVMYHTQDKILLTSLLGLLNSKFASWFYYNYTYNRAIRTMHLIDYYAKQLPVPKELAENHVVANFAVYLSIITQSIITQNDQEYPKAFLDNLLDCVIYELYFKKKFIEDSKKAIEEGKEAIYPQLEKGPFLIDLVAKYLKPIDYDSYAKLAYLIKPLSEEEKQKIEEMKKEYIKTIKEVVKAIKTDKEIMSLIERIKNHEWVKVIEGST